MKKVVSALLAASMAFGLTACSSSTASTSAAASGSSAADGEIVANNTLVISNECAYSPYNWAQDDDSNGAVPIKDSTQYANGYDIMIAKLICEAYGWDLEVIQSDWDSLVPAVQSGTIDCAIAGQSMTSERSEVVDFAGPYFYASMVVVTKSDSQYASAASIHDFSGAKGTAQIATIWYDQCLPQMDGVQIQTATETAPAMLMALETGTVDFVVTDLPTAQGAVAAYGDLTILNYSGTDNDFEFTEEERAENVNIGISVQKGRTDLVEAINAVLSQYTEEDFNEMMAEAIEIAPAE